MRSLLISPVSMYMATPICRLLFEYAGALEGAFLPHVPAAASALIPAVTFRFNEEVRSAAALALAKVNRDQTEVRRLTDQF